MLQSQVLLNNLLAESRVAGPGAAAEHFAGAAGSGQSAVASRVSTDGAGRDRCDAPLGGLVRDVETLHANLDEWTCPNAPW
jgi:hypothetical protein